ncbi:MAG: PEP/pyruvate-binding domain-containing protein [Tepidisphaeraceae bacterium]
MADAVTDPILWPHAATDRAIVGGKAAALAATCAAGFEVPPWFAVVGEVDDATLIRAVERLGPGVPVAVRSSAVDEDGTDHSFAGQFDSFLNVNATDVPAKVRGVRDGATSERVRAYRQEHGLAGPPRAPAVVVQRMIHADAAGVAFSADPVTGRRGVVVVNAVKGLADRLVSGETEGCTYRVGRDGSILERSGDGATMLVTDALLRDIAALAKRCAAHFGRPQDIEWAIEGGRVFLLQSRAITTLNGMPDPDGVRVIWDNSNIAESYGGITTPLTFSFARDAYEGVYRAFCRLMSVPASVVQNNDFIFSRMLGLIRGRVYYNLLNWYRLLAMLPGFKSNRPFMEQMMGVKEPLPDALVAELTAGTSVWRDRLRLTRSMLALVRQHFTMKRSIRAFYRRLEQTLDAPGPALAELRADELAAAFVRLRSSLLSRWDAPLVNDFFAMMFFGTLRKLCEKWIGKPGLHNDLVADEGGIVSTEPARRIMEMAAVARGDPAFIDVLTNGSVARAQSAIESHPKLSALHDAYLAKFAERCLEELKLESATLADDPSSLLRAIGHAARRPAVESKPSTARADAEKRAHARLLNHPLRTRVFRWVLKHARARVRDRENLRFERTRVFGRVRRIFVELGKRFALERLIDDPRDIFYLETHEALGLVDGTISCDDVRGLIRVRKDAFARYAEQPTPDRFETLGAVWINNGFAAAPSKHADTTGDLRGLGCCPGVVRGPVRVIHSPRGAELKPGEIMVALQTDPGWILLFPAAAGILVERGSALSHSAIVAREMRIPAIVSIPNVTTRLTDGQCVEMDGSTGTIRLIDAPTAETSPTLAEAAP